jgi:hypothetical protein
MTTAIILERRTGNGKYSDVIDVCDELGRNEYGSAVNAAAVLIRQSPKFTDTLNKIREREAEEQPRRKRRVG